MPFMTLIAFVFLIASFVSLWFRKDPKVWGSLLALSLFCGLIGGNIQALGILFLIALACFWVMYQRKPTVAFFLFLVLASLVLKMRLLPGYIPFIFTPKFAVGLEGSLIGLFPLAFLVPLSRTTKDWAAASKGMILGCAGIAILAILATLAKATHWQLKLPSFVAARLLSNFFLTCIPEEGFYRGFIQNTLCKYFANFRFGKIGALFLTSALFAAAHMYWSPNIQVLLFVFLAGLLYGGVYLISGKIESSILCHFLLNGIHMIFFSYHAV